MKSKNLHQTSSCSHQFSHKLFQHIKINKTKTNYNPLASNRLTIWGRRLENEASLACMYQTWDNRIKAGPEMYWFYYCKNKNNQSGVAVRWKRWRKQKRRKRWSRERKQQFSTAAWQDGQLAITPSRYYITAQGHMDEHRITINNMTAWHTDKTAIQQTMEPFVGLTVLFPGQTADSELLRGYKQDPTLVVSVRSNSKWWSITTSKHTFISEPNAC